MAVSDTVCQPFCFCKFLCFYVFVCVLCFVLFCFLFFVFCFVLFFVENRTIKKNNRCDSFIELKTCTINNRQQLLKFH